MDNGQSAAKLLQLKRAMEKVQRLRPYQPVRPSGWKWEIPYQLG